MPSDDELEKEGERKHPANIAAGKALLHQYRVMKWKAERSGASSSVTIRLNGRIQELEDALAGLELEAEDYKNDLAESTTERERLEAALDSERAANAVRDALCSAQVEASTALATAVVKKSSLNTVNETEAAIEREKLVRRLGKAVVATRVERDLALQSYADALAASEASEKCVAALAGELASMSRAVEAQSAASEALSSAADRANRRAEMAELRAEQASEGAVRSLDAQNEVIRLQLLLAEAYTDVERLLETNGGGGCGDDEALAASEAVASALQAAFEQSCTALHDLCEQKEDTARAWNAIADAVRKDRDAQLAVLEASRDELSDRLVDVEANSRSQLENALQAKDAVLVDLRRQLDIERAAADELVQSLEDRDDDIKERDTSLRELEQRLLEQVKERSTPAAAVAVQDTSSSPSTLLRSAAATALLKSNLPPDSPLLAAFQGQSVVKDNADAAARVEKSLGASSGPPATDTSTERDALVEKEKLIANLEAKLLEAQELTNAAVRERSELESKLVEARAAAENAEMDRAEIESKLVRTAELAKVAEAERSALEANFAETREAASTVEDCAKTSEIIEQESPEATNDEDGDLRNPQIEADKHMLQLQEMVDESERERSRAIEALSDVRSKLAASYRSIASMEELVAESQESAARADEKRQEVEMELDEARKHLEEVVDGELQELKTKYSESLELAQVADAKHHEVATQLSEALDRARVAEEERVQLETAIAEAQTKSNAAEEKCRDLEAKLDEIGQQSEATAEANRIERRDLEEKLEEARELASASEEELGELKMELAEAISEAQRREEEMMVELRDARKDAGEEAAMATYKEVEESMKASLAAANEAARVALEELAEIESRLRESEEKGETSAKAIGTLQSERDALAAKLTDAESAAQNLQAASDARLGEVEAEAEAVRADCRDLTQKLARIQSDIASKAESAETERRDLESRLSDAKAAAAAAARATVADWQDLENRLSRAMTVVSTALVFRQDDSQRDAPLHLTSQEIENEQPLALVDSSDSQNLSADGFAGLQRRLAVVEAEATAARASLDSEREAAKSRENTQIAELVEARAERDAANGVIHELDERLACVSAANARDADQLAVETEMLRSALETVKAEREALRTDTDMLQGALERVKAENVDLKRFGRPVAAHGNVRDIVIAEDDDQLATPFASAGNTAASVVSSLSGDHIGHASSSPAAGVDQLRAMANACDDKIRVHVEAAADSIAAAFAKEFEKRDELKRCITRYREERDQARFERDSEKRRADAATQAAEEAVAKAGSERDEALERAEAAEDDLALMRVGPCVVKSQGEALIDALLDEAAKMGGDTTRLDAIAADFVAGCALVTEERHGIERALAAAVRERDRAVERMHADTASAARAEAHAARVEAVRAEALQAAAELRAAQAPSSRGLEDDAALETMRRELQEATRARALAEKSAKKQAQRVHDLEQRFAKEAARSQRLEAQASDMLSQLALVEGGRSSLVPSKGMELIGMDAENRCSSLPAKRASAAENKALRDELRSLRMNNLELRAQRDELSDDLSHVRSELSRTRLVIHGIEHYSHMSATGSISHHSATL